MPECTLTGDGVTFFHLASQVSALKLEGKGIRFKRSVLAHCKRVYNLTGNRARVIAEMEKMKDALIEQADKAKRTAEFASS